MKTRHPKHNLVALLSQRLMLGFHAVAVLSWVEYELRTIDDMDARMGLANFATKRRLLDEFGKPDPKLVRCTADSRVVMVRPIPPPSVSGASLRLGPRAEVIDLALFSPSHPCVLKGLLLINHKAV